MAHVGGHGHETGLFSAEAIQAANRDPPQVDNEAALVEEMRAKLGPSPSHRLLLHHVRGSRGKIWWAVNCYFRDAFISGAAGACGGATAARMDFEPQHVLPPPLPPPPSRAPPADGTCSEAKPLPADTAAVAGVRGLAQASLNAASSSGGDTAAAPPAPPAAAGTGEESAEAVDAPSGALDGFPSSLLEQVVWHLDAWSVCQVARVNRAFSKATASDAIWNKLFQAAAWDGVVFPTDSLLGQQQQQHPQPGAQQNGARQHAAPPPAPRFVPAVALGAVAEGPPSLALPAASRPQGVGPKAAGCCAGRGSEQPRDVTGGSSSGTARSAAEGALGATSGNSGGGGEASVSSCARPSGSEGFAREDSGVCWRTLYKRQALLVYRMQCPRCGPGGRIIPIIYGFPSRALLEARQSKRLILGGDHLISDCHVWACTSCGASFRTFPYERPRQWMAELAAQASRMAAGPQDGRTLYTYEL